MIICTDLFLNRISLSYAQPHAAVCGFISYCSSAGLGNTLNHIKSLSVLFLGSFLVPLKTLKLQQEQQTHKLH